MDTSSWAVAALTSNGVGTCGADDNQAQANHLIVQPMAIRGREGGAEVELGNDGDPYFAVRVGNGGAHNMVSITEKRSTVSTIQNRIPGTNSESCAGGHLVPVQPQAGDAHIDEHGKSTTVRRLTELECERLQGYPDGWTDGQTGSARYRQLGNSVAVPVVEWIARRLVSVDGEVGA